MGAPSSPSTVDSTNLSTSDFSMNTTTNSTASSTYHYYGDSLMIPLSVLLVIIIIFAVVGNLMVVLTVLRHRGMRTRTNMFIVNLAIADILVAILDMPVSLTTLIKGDWVFNNAFCQFNGFTMALFLMCSIHTLMYISVHKFVSITRPFSRVMTPERILILIAAAWIWPIICASLPLFGLTEIVYKTGATQCGPALPSELRQYVHSFIINATNYLIPLVVMVYCYCHIFRAIAVHMDRIRTTSNIDLRNSVEQQKRVTVTLFLVLACFLICWTPFIIYATLANIVKNKSKIPEILNPISYWCGYLNSACNPVIYAFRSPSFRHGYLELIFGRKVVIESGESFTMKSSSFRNRSLHQGTHSRLSTLTRKPPIGQARKKRFLSQTSWMSLPLISIPKKLSAISDSTDGNIPGGTLRRYRSESQVEKDSSPDNKPISSQGTSARPVSIILEVPSEDDCTGSNLQMDENLTVEDKPKILPNGNTQHTFEDNTEKDLGENV